MKPSAKWPAALCTAGICILFFVVLLLASLTPPKVRPVTYTWEEIDSAAGWLENFIGAARQKGYAVLAVGTSDSRREFIDVTDADGVVYRYHWSWSYRDWRREVHTVRDDPNGNAMDVEIIVEDDKIQVWAWGIGTSGAGRIGYYREDRTPIPSRSWHDSDSALAAIRISRFLPVDDMWDMVARSDEIREELGEIADRLGQWP